MPQTSLVLELQALAQAKATDLGELLRRAKVVAVKLGLADTAAWIEHELGGYPPDEDVPAYRRVTTQLMTHNPFHGSAAVVFDGEFEMAAKHFGSAPVRQPVGEVADLVRDPKGTLELALSADEMGALLKLHRNFRSLRTYRAVSRSGMVGILDAVRNKVLDWALDLEQRGVLGEGMTFTQQERETAASVTILNFGSMVQGDHGSIASASHSPGANVAAATGGADVRQRLRVAIQASATQDPSLGEALARLAEAIETREDLPVARKADAAEQLAYVAEQAALPEEKRDRKPVLRAVLGGFREALGLGADVLQVWGTFGPVICSALGVPFVG